MSKHNSLFRCLIFYAALLLLPEVQAATSVNVGHNNPQGAYIGANIMQLWTEWAVEAGLGYVRSGRDVNDRSATIFTGDIDAKYLLPWGSFRPYVQGGMSWGFSTTGKNNAFYFGDRFHTGLGFFVMGSGVYTYASYNIGTNTVPFFQVGLGFDI